MGESLLFGLVASSALLLGSVAGAWLRFPERLLAAMLSFAAGALITALSFELFQDSYENGGIWRAAAGMMFGAAVFTGLSAALDRWATPAGRSPMRDRSARRKGSVKLDKDAATVDRPASSASTRGAAGLALLAAVTLDGIPESLALGVSLNEGSGGLALLAAIFAANFPEALVGSASMRAQGRSSAFILSTWGSVSVLLVVVVLIGAGPLSAAAPETLSLPLAFAAGAVLASLADTVIPEAYKEGGPLVAMTTTLGFVVAFLLATL